MSSSGVILISILTVLRILSAVVYSAIIANILTGYSPMEDIKSTYSKAVSSATNKSWSTKRELV